MSKLTTKKREELLSQYGTQTKKKKEPLPTYGEVQQIHLKLHAPVTKNKIKVCGICTQLIDGEVMSQEYPCASLQRVGLGNG